MSVGKSMSGLGEVRAQFNEYVVNWRNFLGIPIYASLAYRLQEESTELVNVCSSRWREYLMTNIEK
jgi:hypothetical protein